MKKILETAVLVATALIVCLTFSTGAQAAEDITILDTSGVMRAQGSLEGSANGEVTMTVVDTATGKEVADGTVISLTPTAGGEPITAVTSGGLAVFTALPAGTYTVASTSAITFTSVAVSTGTVVAAGSVAGGTAAAVGVGLAGAGGITAVALNENNSNDSTPLSPIR